MSNELSLQAKKVISVWLMTGIVMVVVQIMLGGITRLTDSGLSITEWDIVGGTIPPLNETEWVDAFTAYKTHASKQYSALHADMTLSEFKWIYFWEWIHRNWARFMGIVFMIPFIFFLVKKWMPKWLLKRLLIVVFLAGLEGVVGWIMVASGLNDDQRTWVSAYKLIIHLGLATLLLAYLFWTYLCVYHSYNPLNRKMSSKSSRLVTAILVMLFAQIVLGGLMAGMRAALVYPHWPVFMGGSYLFDALFSREAFSLDSLINYEPSLYIKAWVQISHRGLAFLLLFMSCLLLIFFRKEHFPKKIERAKWIAMACILAQYVLGIVTVISSIGKIPVSWGMLHQLGAFVSIGAFLYLLFLLRSYVPEKLC